MCPKNSVPHTLSLEEQDKGERERERKREVGREGRRWLQLIITSGGCEYVCLSGIVINYLGPCRHTKQPLKSLQMLFSHHEKEKKLSCSWVCYLRGGWRKVDKNLRPNMHVLQRYSSCRATKRHHVMAGGWGREMSSSLASRMKDSTESPSSYRVINVPLFSSQSAAMEPQS